MRTIVFRGSLWGSPYFGKLPNPKYQALNPESAGGRKPPWKYLGLRTSLAEPWRRVQAGQKRSWLLGVVGFRGLGFRGLGFRVLGF